MTLRREEPRVLVVMYTVELARLVAQDLERGDDEVILFLIV